MLFADKTSIYERDRFQITSLNIVHYSMNIIVMHFVNETVLHTNLKRKLWSFTFTIKVMTLFCSLLVSHFFSKHFVKTKLNFKSYLNYKNRKDWYILNNIFNAI